MKTYLIKYWTEMNDESVDFEIEVECEKIDFAITEFKKKVQVYKKIESITEK